MIAAHVSGMPDRMTVNIMAHLTKESEIRAAQPSRGHAGFTLLAFFVVLILLGSPALFIWTITPNWVRYPVVYGLWYRVPLTRIDVDKEPSDCEWMHAPVGDKSCHYEKKG